MEKHIKPKLFEVQDLTPFPKSNAGQLSPDGLTILASLKKLKVGKGFFIRTKQAATTRRIIKMYPAEFEGYKLVFRKYPENKDFTAVCRVENKVKNKTKVGRKDKK